MTYQIEVQLVVGRVHVEKLLHGYLPWATYY
jgi:hypothetical protein